jgi:hypothetical protein
MSAFEREQKQASQQPVSRRPSAGAGAGSRTQLLIDLQQTVGSRVMAPLLQRSGDLVAAGLWELLGFASEKVDPHDDLSKALVYVTQYYQGMRDQINQVMFAKDAAEGNYKDFGKLKDPPSLSAEILLQIAKTACALVPGGAAVARLLTYGKAAGDLVTSIDWSTQTGDPFEGLTEMRKRESEAKEEHEKHVEAGRARLEAGTKTVDSALAVGEMAQKVDEWKARQAEAKEAENEAREYAKLRDIRLTEWTSATQTVEKDENDLTQWLEHVSGSGRLRGHLRRYVELRLGPKPQVSLELKNAIVSQYELHLYKEHFGGAQGVAKFVRYEHFDRGERWIGPGGLEGGPSQATRRRIAYVAGLNANPDSDDHTDDKTMIELLEIASTTRTATPRPRFHP